ncbi:hypothetical protein HPB50_012815 [Hyalomma asiaticum]|uniref:Uncharacterized protein n=1 Tax=Hyalomma asiaticum TaxID=266040 RepID=A0ACB7SMX8_HYAAI|nr:hypothetical protein HPB50_012815 [Hyalomma asiaticum]
MPIRLQLTRLSSTSGRPEEACSKAQDYADQISRRNWHEFYDSLQGTLSTKKTWGLLLRGLLATKPTKAVQKQHLHKLIHNHSGSEEELLQELQKKLCGSVAYATSKHTDEYAGTPNPELDRPFTQAELCAALSKLTRNTRPGKDGFIIDSLRLGLPIHKGLSGAAALPRLQRTLPLTRVVKRMANQRHGLKEEDMLSTALQSHNVRYALPGLKNPRNRKT